MTVAEMQNAVRGVDPSHTVVARVPGKGKEVRYVPVTFAAERVLCRDGKSYVLMETLADPNPATVFVVEG